MPRNRPPRGLSAAIFLMSGVVVQFSLSIPVIWGVFQPFVMREYGWSGPATAMAYTLTNAFFAAGVLIGGRLQDRISPRRVVMGGVLLAAAGLYATSFTPRDDPRLMYLAFGIVNGIGGGSAVTAVVTPAQKWFADRRGLAVGVLATSTAIAGIVLTPVCKALLTAVGVVRTFRILGVGVLLVGTAGSWPIRNPPYAPGEDARTEHGPRRDLTTREMLGTKQFYVLALIMFFAAPAFVLMNPLVMTLSIARGLTDSVATGGVALVAVANSLGRIVLPIASDLLGRRKVVTGTLAASSVAALSLVRAQGHWVIAAAAVVAFVHGGALSMLPAISSALFGLGHAGQNYGTLFLGSGASALLAQVVSSHWQLAGGSTAVPLIAGACSVTAAFILTAVFGRKTLG